MKWNPAEFNIIHTPDEVAFIHDALSYYMDMNKNHDLFSVDDEKICHPLYDNYKMMRNGR